MMLSVSIDPFDSPAWPVAASVNPFRHGIRAKKHPGDAAFYQRHTRALMTRPSGRPDDPPRIDMPFPMLQSQTLRLPTPEQIADLRCRFDLS
ncbi:hypothetical protein FA743_19180 [Paracoccus gahaiensis]|uniref:Uncharacterized protein n=1 Tax=Paracoccus gahaiensis TaxID=1706839 RepID=A0A4U0R367_9RHOB|nr:hypothetical protein [Paracoccus gahaiensis]TJZ89301.1 hypothetical protein FA743_19180 [Paracoccus gahaiensis]